MELIEKDLNEKIKENREFILKAKTRIELIDVEKLKLQQQMLISEGQARAYSALLDLNLKTKKTKD